MNRLKAISYNSALIFLITLAIILISRSSLHVLNINTYYISYVLGCISIITITISILSTFPLVFFLDKNITYFFGNVILAIAVGSTFYFTYIFDYSWDGMSYHLPSILFLKEGWNPIRDPNVSLILTNSYPNGFWSLSAVFGEILGSHEYGKAVNGFLAITFSILSIHLVEPIQKKLDRTIILLLINCMFFSNVICQFFGNYLDGSIYIVFSLFIVVILLWRHGIRSYYYNSILVSLLVILINTKTSGLYFAFLGIIIYFIMILNKIDGNYRQKILTSSGITLKFGLATAALGVFLVGWRPWVTNIIDHNSVFYPNPHGTISVMAPANLKDYNIFRNITYAIYGYHAEAIPPDTAHLKFPFTVDAKEFHVAPLGPRSGGFGPLFGAIFTLALVVRILSFFIYKLKLNFIDYISIIILFGCALLPGSWWARFIPMVYLIPILLMIRTLDLKIFFPKMIAIGLIVLFGLNFIPTLIFYRHLSAYALYVETTLQQLRENKMKVVIIHSDPFGDVNSMSHIVWSKRLSARAVPHRMTRDMADCSEEILVSAFVSICRDKS